MYYTTSVLFLLCTIFSVGLAVINVTCLAACDAANPGGNLVTFCSTDGVTLTARQAALLPKNLVRSSCYSACGTALQYLGTCGCPNGCYADTGNGICNNSTNKCDCAAQWKGNDCTFVKCPGSSCSGHGTCVDQKEKDGDDYCQCDDGWTAADCSVRIPDGLRANTGTPYGSLPYGETTLSSVPYFQKDDNKDAHPVFNTSRIATVKITLSDDDLKKVLNPATVLFVDWVPAKATFNNGLVSKVLNSATVKLKGSATRLDMKKSWNLKFGETWKDLKGITLKTNQQDRAVTSQLVVDFYRGLKAQTYRTSFAELWINEVYQGLLTIQEKFDDKLMTSRFDVKNENMYKVGARYAMTYVGDNQSDYINLSNTLYDGISQLSIEQEEGNGDWSDFVTLVAELNSTGSGSLDYLTNHFDIPAFMRSMAIEAITKNADGYCGTSNNYIFSESRKTDRPFWNFIGYDFDQALYPFEETIAPILGLTVQQLLDLVAQGVTIYRGLNLQEFIPSNNPYVVVSHPSKPLTQAIFRVPGSNDTYTQALKEFVKLFIVNFAGRTQARRQAFYDLARPIVARDKMYTIQTGSNLAYFDSTNQRTINWINTQWAYLATNFYADGHGTCDANGVCVCNQGYFGAACDQFCGVQFNQVKNSDWTTGSTWSVTLAVGSKDLSSVRIAVNSNGATFSPWNIDNVAGNIYKIPAWQYQSGIIPAGSNSVSFGYTISGTAPASFSLADNACIPKSCSVSVVPQVTSSWTSGNLFYQGMQLAVTNNEQNAVISSVNVRMSFVNNAYVSSSWNLSPGTTAPGQASQVFNCPTWNLNPGQTSTGCGYVLTTSVANQANVNAVVNVNQALCIF